jgi:hypothetical protein
MGLAYPDGIGHIAGRAGDVLGRGPHRFVAGDASLDELSCRHELHALACWS